MKRTDSVRQPLRPRSLLVGGFLLLLSLVLATATAFAYVTGIDPIAAATGWGSTPPAVATPEPTPVLPAPTPTPAPLLTPLPADLPISAEGALLLQLEPETVLFERNADTPLPPASTAKIVTALTVLRHAGLEELVTVQPEDVVDPALESSMGLQAGDVLTVHDLLVGLLLPSGNDAAKALSRTVGARLPGEAPPVARFAAAMNAVAADLGMAHSHFVEPSGNDAEGQVVTARDMAAAARALLREPALLPIVAMPRAEVRVGGPQARVLRLENTNELLATEGVFGIKTGTTEQAGQCLVVAYRAATGPQIAVILRSQDRYTDARTLLGLPAPPPSPPA
ncbi:MAG: serine hydrolase [Sphaerobacter sp.]|nr:serine hydrolase [Sphaerobacter sp.]